MYLQALKNVMKARGLKKADVARLAGVSRAAVTRWFRLAAKQKGWVNVESRTLSQLTDVCGIESGLLLEKQRISYPKQSTSFLWEYPLSFNEIHKILRGSQKKRLWLVGKILEHGKWDEIWQFLTLRQIKADLPLLRLPDPTKRHWEYALKRWEARREDPH